MSGGWGGSPWGGSPWGGGYGGGSFVVQSAEALRENVVRLGFGLPIYFSRRLDAFDGYDPRHYVVAPVAGTTDGNGDPTRAVNVVSVDLPDDASDYPTPPGGAGYFVDVSLDRPMSSYPSTYTITCTDLQDAARVQTLASQTLDFFGVYREIQAPILETAGLARDIANPQTVLALGAQGASVTPLVTFASYLAAEDGDYAYDSGDVSRKKRIIRRYLTKKGGFLWMPNYGIGVMEYAKRPGTLARIGELISTAKVQLEQEPDIAKAIVTTDLVRVKPSILRIHNLIKPKGGRSQKLTVSVPMG